jgi:hypothetical protein
MVLAKLQNASGAMDKWRLDYNHWRIQRALGKLTPAAFAARCPAVPQRSEPERRQRWAWRGQLRYDNFLRGWTDESDPLKQALVTKSRLLRW